MRHAATAISTIVRQPFANVAVNMMLRRAPHDINCSSVNIYIVERSFGDVICDSAAFDFRAASQSVVSPHLQPRLLSTSTRRIWVAVDDSSYFGFGFKYHMKRFALDIHV